MTESLAAEARRLRMVEGRSVREIQQRLGVGKHRLYEWLRGVPAPQWTRRPNAKDELRARAEQLRRDGWSVPEIAAELGVAKSTAYQWVKHLAREDDSDHARSRRERYQQLSNARWQSHRVARDSARASTHRDAAAWLGALTERDLLLVGALIYWCEGEKAKPWRPNDCRLCFTNSDPGLVDLFVRFVEALGVPRDQLNYRVSIHESADAAAATEWWARRIGVPPDRMQRPTLKRHKPVTNRHNTTDDYHGCLVVRVPQGRRHYWWIEGVVAAVVGATGSA